MKKTDSLTFIGLIVSTVLVLVGAAKGSSSGLKNFFDVSSILITVLGSFGALMITFTIDDIKLIKNALQYSFKTMSVSKLDLLEQFKTLSKKARKEGLLSIESDVMGIEDPFMKKGLELCIDGLEINEIRSILELEIDSVEDTNNRYSKLFKTWGTFAPAFGMLGTLIGLIQMLADLTSPDLIASGMGKALITTFYGSLLANIALNPILYNIDEKTEKEIYVKEMMLEGIISIQSGESSIVVEERLATYLSNNEKLEIMKSNKNTERAMSNGA